MTEKNVRRSNYILHAKSAQFHWDGTGLLSIKTFSNGKAYYKTNHGYFAVEEGNYLLLNQGPYTITIDEQKEVESFCVFFQEDFANDVFRNLSVSDHQLLDDPYTTHTSASFFEKTYEQSPILTHQLNLLKYKTDQFQNDSSLLDEQFHSTMDSLLREQMKVFKEIHQLDLVRKSTREEIYKRVSIAHEYIRAFYDKQLTLDEIAAVSCLSPNHLLRNYSTLYKKTPFQHIAELRIAKSITLLKTTEYSMTDITYEIGLNNPVSFSRLFKQHVGTSPLQYRKKVILDKK
ncbi:helix-turn-helix domain-containing protein [Fictibacillus phosphorivorans]|uniref:helix-turn-helix domain-containing protein n=1 Tax=Fictibacillus phosphorivorans TaxID=1221500 RepID=UPI001293B42D|nr:AraC family transcriptional regulator [Fictibacillus phosphorivorans]MQR94169.1 AraC family transcriptional regulator [Fictibacillus phosphorivorans]